MYEYTAKVLKVISADTLDLDIDLGFNIRHKHKVKLSRINAPEMSTAEGRISTKFVKELIEGTNIRIISEKKINNDINDIYFTEVFIKMNVEDFPNIEVNLNLFLVDNDFARWSKE